MTVADELWGWQAFLRRVEADKARALGRLFGKAVHAVTPNKQIEPFKGMTATRVWVDEVANWGEQSNDKNVAGDG